jgi:hypothetical protein
MSFPSSLSEMTNGQYFAGRIVASVIIITVVFSGWDFNGPDAIFSCWRSVSYPLFIYLYCYKSSIVTTYFDDIFCNFDHMQNIVRAYTEFIALQGSSICLLM